MAETKPVGLTASAGYQIGVRRTIAMPQHQVWELLISPQGLKLWLGDVKRIGLHPGDRFETNEGTTGEMRVAKEPEQLRLTWQPSGWEKASTLQIRVLAGKAERTTVSFHQEKLDSAVTREAMKLRWEEVLLRLSEIASERLL
ncbi:SRPBCC family protein [Paenibacillus hexagrammi]|uniref:SRPBCC domain-containing protein n=1 Tax=Paenibacillus hexagrammi TaxID=2908839 RepID=A0ABY3SR46_9BACL|nr:SRPBCC domain-containing protein [Paenibacillus sp. YPD9-1]UJF35442.1 SRPBCC domain-containing protein [Paenibacillus sp. YPD9-1]